MFKHNQFYLKNARTKFYYECHYWMPMLLNCVLVCTKQFHHFIILQCRQMKELLTIHYFFPVISFQLLHFPSQFQALFHLWHFNWTFQTDGRNFLRFLRNLTRSVWLFQIQSGLLPSSIFSCQWLKIELLGACSYSTEAFHISSTSGTSIQYFSRRPGSKFLV